MKVLLRSLLACFQFFSRNSGEIIDEIVAIGALSHLILVMCHVFFFENMACRVFYLQVD